MGSEMCIRDSNESHHHPPPPWDRAEAASVADSHRSPSTRSDSPPSKQSDSPLSKPQPNSLPPDLRLSPRAWLIQLPLGTLDWCADLQAHREQNPDSSSPPPKPPTGFPKVDGDLETVLLFAHRHNGAHRLADVRTEKLGEAVGEILSRSRSGTHRTERAAFAREQGARPEDLESFLMELIQEGILERVGNEG